MNLYGMQIIESPFLPSTRFVETPPKNRREARKRAIIARRRRRAGRPVPQYGKHENVVWVMDNKMFVAPGMTMKIEKFRDEVRP